MEFRLRLARAARVTLSTGHETGFCYFEDYDVPQARRVHWSSVIEGGPSAMRFGPHLEEHDIIKASWIEDLLPLLHIHLHPHRYTLDLSQRDIQNALPTASDPDVRAIYGIGTIRDDMTGALLLLHATGGAGGGRGGVFDQAWANYERCLHLWPSPDFAAALRVPGFLAASVIPYEIPKASRYAQLGGTQSLVRDLGLSRSRLFQKKSGE